MRSYVSALSAFALTAAVSLAAQTSSPVTTNSGVPPASAIPSAAPSPSLGLTPQAVAPPSGQDPAGTLPLPLLNELPQALALAPAVPADSPPLTLEDAEKIALAHNPRIAISRLLALGQAQTVREQRAAELPVLAANLTAVMADPGSRITAGALNNPVLYSRAAAGLTLSQLLTDFGRSHNLVASAELRTRALENTALATREDILFAVEEAFYRALGAQALIQVANQTVNTRQVTANQVQALARARLRSTLDLNFAAANLAQAQLLLLDARNQSATAQAALSALLGNDSSMIYRLIDQTPSAPSPAPTDAQPLVQLAFSTRPDLTSLQQQAEAETRFAKAEADLKRPSIIALGAAGGAPVRADQVGSAFYGAVGVNVNVPIFNGGLYSARAEEARLRSAAAEQQVQQLRQAIVRDVTTTVLQAQSNFNRIAVAQALTQQAESALALAQTRYNLGLSSIVELSQAQLLQTQAQIELTNARYTYQGSVAAIRYQTAQ